MTAWAETKPSERWERSDGARVFRSDARHEGRTLFVAVKPAFYGGGIVRTPRFARARLFAKPTDAIALLDREYPARG